MALSPEEIQLLISDSRTKLEEDKKRMDSNVKRMRENPPVSTEEAISAIPEDDGDSVLDYITEEGKVLGATALGTAELMAEFGSGMFGAFAGTVAQHRVGDTRSLPGVKGVLDALTVFPLEKPRPGFDKLKENNSMKNYGDIFLDNFQDYTDAMTYQPRTVQGQAISKWAQKLFHKFQDWGEQAGDAVYEETGSPLISAAVETAITGVPVYVPFIAGKVLSRSTDATKLTRREEVITDVTEGKETLSSVNEISQNSTKGVEGLQKLIDDIIPDTQAIDNKRIQAKLDKQRKALEKQTSDPNQGTLNLEDFPTKKADPAIPHPDKGAKLADNEAKVRADKVDRIQEASIDASGKRRLPTVGQIADKLMETTFDATAGLRRRILNGLDKAQNRQLELTHNKVAGATPKAQLDYQRFESKIYQGLDGTETTNLNKVINSMRTIQIDRSAKIKKKLPPKHSGNLTGVDHVFKLSDIEKTLGKKAYQGLVKRANAYFDITNGLLKDIYAEGLISKKQYNSMKGDIYEPRKFLEKLDPANPSLSSGVLAFDIHGKNVKINDSGLQELSKGSIDLMELDSKALLQEYTVRAVNRIWRNQANVKMLDWVKANKDNGFARIAKEGEKVGDKGKIDAYIDGKKTSIFMDKGMALQWVGNTYVMGHGFSNFMRTASGQFIMKPLTTGMNPEFALKLFGVDIVHAFFATDVFSASAPVYTLQLGKNLGVTMKDAFFKGERFQQYINEGGGMNFLTHQGTDVFGGKGVIRNNTTWRKTKSALSFLNEGFEVWVRLAIRERAIKMGKSPEEATLLAREYIDFSQGGTVSKALDTGLPYFNSVLQATRTLARGAKRNPARFAYQTAELAAITSAWAMYQELYFPEVMNDISAEDKAKFWMFPTGRSIRNQQGETQHAYVKIRKDNVVAALINPAEMSIRNYVTGQKPDDQTLAYFKSSSPVLPVELSTPFGAAMHTYSYNHDFWGNPVWNDPDLDVGLSPENEFKVANQRGEASSVFYRDVGQALGISPELLKDSIENVAPSNSYLDFGGWVYKKMVGEIEDPFLAQDTFEQQMVKAPFLRKMMTLTHPAHRIMEESKRPRTESQVHRKNQRDKLDSLIINNTGRGTVQQWVRQQPDEDQERLLTSYHAKIELHKIFNGKKDMSLNVPGPFFWNHVASEIKNPESKAEVLYWEWRKMPTNTDRAQFMSIANRLSVNKQIWPSTTMKHFRVMQGKWGTEGIMTDEDGGDYRRFSKRHYMDELVFE